MEISIISYSFHHLFKQQAIDLFGYLETVKYRYHLSAADIWNGMLASTEDEYLRKVKDAIHERGLALANLCVDGAHVWEPDAQVRDQNHQSALVHLRVAEALGAQSVRIDTGGHTGEMSEEQFDYTVSKYQEYAERAHDHGYKVGPENHWGCSVVPKNMLRLIEAVNHPAFGILLHFGNWTDDAAQSDKLVAGYAFHTHFEPLVESRYREKLGLLERVGYSGCCSVEHYSGQNEYTEAEYHIASLRRSLRELRTP